MSDYQDLQLEQPLMVDGKCPEISKEGNQRLCNPNSASSLNH